jgi:YHS domain-containing protein
MSTLFWILLIGLGLWWLLRSMSHNKGGGGMMGGGCCGGGHSHHGSHNEHGKSHQHPESRQIGEMVVDPVCNTAVDKNKIAYTLDYGGTTFYLCSSKCYGKFKADPEKYVLKHLSAS